MSLPYSVSLNSSLCGFTPSEQLMEMLTEEVNDFLSDKYGYCNNGWCYELIISDIDWDVSEKTRFNHLSEQYALSAKVYFDVLKMALYRCEGIVAKTSTEVVQNMPTDCERVYKIANNIVEAMYGGNE